jgi:hypothetical protein
MGSKRKKDRPKTRAAHPEQPVESDQKTLWPEEEDTTSLRSASDGISDPPQIARASSGKSKGDGDGRERRTIQDLLLSEGLLAARLAEGLGSLAELQQRLIQ